MINTLSTLQAEIKTMTVSVSTIKMLLAILYTTYDLTLRKISLVEWVG